MDKRKKVLFLDHAAALGGAEFSLLQLMQGLAGSGWEVHVACPEGQLSRRSDHLGLNVHLLDLPRLRGSTHFFRDLRETSREIASLASDQGVRCLVANTVRAAFFTAFGAARAKIPWIWYMRDFWLSESRPRFQGLDRLGKRFLAARAKWIIANSQAVAGQLPFRKKVRVIHNGVDAGEYVPRQGRSEFRRRYGIPQDSIVIGTAARLRPWKGVDRFIKAAAVFDKQPYFLVVGGNPFEPSDGYAETLQNLAGTLGLGDRIVFSGHLEDIRPALAAMDVFVHAGDPEPFGRVNIEAMAMQLPVIGFAHGALPEIVADGETGILVPPTGRPSLAEAMLELTRAHERTGSMGRAGKTRVETIFSESKMIAAFSAMLESS